MSEGYCGCDFGTSNSTVGIAAGGEPRLSALEDGAVTLPSAVFFDYGNDSVRFGRDAIAAYVDGHEGRLLRSLKSVLGSALAREKTQVKRQRLPFTEIIGLLLRHLKTRAEEDLRAPIDSVVLGRPVRFVDNDDAADAQAAQELIAIAVAQGFRHVELQYEPVAAALDYETSLRREELAMIVDLGGGTSDFAITRLSPERARHADRAGDILGRSGVRIGGTDFDRMLSLAYVMPELGLHAKMGPKRLGLPVGIFHDLATWHRIPSLYTEANLRYLRSLRRTVDRPDQIERLLGVLVHHDGHRLNAAVEAAKITLSDVDEAKLALPFALPVPLVITRRELEEALRHGIERIVRGMTDCLAGAGVAPGDIGSVFLTGGSTSIPAVRAAVLTHLPNARPVQGDLFGSVGLGLTIDAARRFGAGA